MIARGQIHSSGPRLAAYLTTGKEGERAELVELRGVASDDIREAFTALQFIAEQTNAAKPFFHAHIRLADNEALSREQWLKVADRMERVLGFEGQARAVAFHDSAAHGRHLHIAWSRIDADSMKAIDPGLFVLKMRDEARRLESEFGLRELRNEAKPERLTKAAHNGEFEQARRLNTDLDATRNSIRQAWDASDSGPALKAALVERGLILAAGDRRDFVVIDARGGDHALSKRVCGITAGEIKKRLGGDEFKRSLPSVDEAKELQRQRQGEREREQERQQGSGRKAADSSSPRVTVATTDAGLVAQEREAMRQLKRQARDARVKAVQADINTHARSDDGPNKDGGRKRSRGR